MRIMGTAYSICSWCGDFVSLHFLSPFLAASAKWEPKGIDIMRREEFWRLFRTRPYHFIFTQFQSRVCIIGSIFFIADNDNNFEFIGDTDNSLLSAIKFYELYDWYS